MDYSRLSDSELLLMFKDGDIEGFNMLFHRHWKALYGLAKKILGEQDVAKDTLQETFISFYQNAKQNDISQIKPYLMQTMKNQCFMVLRAGRISQKHLDRLQRAQSVNSTEEYIHAEELRNLLLQQMECLPDKCREVFYLSRYELLSNKKIAEQLNISQKTVEHQITKALKTLRLSIDKLALIVFFVDF